MREEYVCFLAQESSSCVKTPPSEGVTNRRVPAHERTDAGRRSRSCRDLTTGRRTPLLRVHIADGLTLWRRGTVSRLASCMHWTPKDGSVFNQHLAGFCLGSVGVDHRCRHAAPGWRNLVRCMVSGRNHLASLASPRTGSCWAVDGITRKRKSLGLVSACESSWQSLSAASWLVHKTHGCFRATHVPPLVPFPLPPHPYFSFLFLYPCLPPLSWCLSHLSLRPTSFVDKAAQPARSHPLLPRPLSGITSCVPSLPLSNHLISLFLKSHIKPTLTMAFAAANMVTTGVIRRPRINSRFARPVFSTRSMVSELSSPFLSARGRCVSEATARFSGTLRELSAPSLV